MLDEGCCCFKPKLKDIEEGAKYKEKKTSFPKQFQKYCHDEVKQETESAEKSQNSPSINANNPKTPNSSKSLMKITGSPKVKKEVRIKTSNNSTNIIRLEKPRETNPVQEILVEENKVKV